MPALVKEILLLKDLQQWYTMEEEDDSTDASSSLWDLIDARITQLERVMAAAMQDERYIAPGATITK